WPRYHPAGGTAGQGPAWREAAGVLGTRHQHWALCCKPAVSAGQIFCCGSNARSANSATQTGDSDGWCAAGRHAMSGIRLLPACLTQRRHVRVNTRSPTFRASAVALCLAAGAGCKHEIVVDPIEVKPIHMTLDINLK